MTKKALVFGTIFLFVVFGVLAQQKSKPKQKVAPKQVVVEEIAAIENENPEFSIELKVENQKENYKVDEELAIVFKANKDCYLTLLNVATDGQVYKIFPNEFQKENFVKAGEEYRVPSKDAKFRLKIKSPSGTDVVKAIATLGNVPVVNEESFKEEGSIEIATKGQKTIAVEIVENLQKVEEKNWAEAEVIIKVAE